MRSLGQLPTPGPGDDADDLRTSMSVTPGHQTRFPPPPEELRGFYEPLEWLIATALREQVGRFRELAKVDAEVPTTGLLACLLLEATESPISTKERNRLATQISTRRAERRPIPADWPRLFADALELEEPWRALLLELARSWNAQVERSRRPAYDRQRVVAAVRRALAKPSAERSTIVFGDVSNLPLRNPNFVGRKDLLEDLRDALSTDKVALHGLPGAGKTQLAIEYAYEEARRYQLVWVVNAENETALITDLAALARKLDLRSALAPSVEAAKAVVELLNGYSGWLLIFDNATTPTSLRPHLPRGLGDVVITSPRRGWSSVGKPIEVKPELDREDSITLLRTQDPDAAEGDADAVAEALGDLPLALEQARAYMERTGINVAKLVSRVGIHLGTVLSEQPRSGYPKSVATAWLLALTEVDREDLARQALVLCSYLAPNSIPRFLLGICLSRQIPTLSADDPRLDGAIGT